MSAANSVFPGATGPEQPAEQGLDPALAAAGALARQAAAEEAGAEYVGEHVGVVPEPSGAATHLFDSRLPGYRGWRWAVTVAVADAETEITVSEVVLLPGPDALVAPAWVPWQQRVRAGDLGVGDLMPPTEDDPRLVPAYLQSDDPEVEAVATELGLGRVHVLSRLGRMDAAERWQESDFGPGSDMARSAPEHCGTCGFYLQLAGSLRAAFGVCGNEISPADGRVVHAGYGCGAHSEIEVSMGSPVPVADLVYDDTVLDMEPVDTTEAEAEPAEPEAEAVTPVEPDAETTAEPVAESVAVVPEPETEPAALAEPGAEATAEPAAVEPEPEAEAAVPEAELAVPVEPSAEAPAESVSEPKAEPVAVVAEPEPGTEAAARVEPGTEAAVVAESAAPEAGAAELDAPVANRAEAAEPEAAEPENAKSEAAESETAEPEAAEPVAAVTEPEAEPAVREAEAVAAPEAEPAGWTTVPDPLTEPIALPWLTGSGTPTTDAAETDDSTAHDSAIHDSAIHDSATDDSETEGQS